MDTLRGQFDPADFSEDLHDFEFAEDDGLPEPPPSPIGQDERRMQVRAYNHWAGQLGNRNFPNIEDLEPEKLDDFGPYSVLLGFTGDIENPDVRFVGAELAQECDAGEGIGKLSDVPSRSLLSRITDHYMQILANQAPIGFEAEFVNQRGRTILYRGILLPYSSDNETIDYIYGVINWKEMADQQTTDELMLEIDQALEGTDPGDAAIDEEDESNILDLASFQPSEEEELDSAAQDAPAGDDAPAMPKPTFGSLLTPEGYEDDDDDEFSLPADWRLSDPTAETDGEYADDSADVYDEDFDPETTEDEEDESNELGLSRLIESEFERAERKPIDLSALDIEEDAIDPEEPGADTLEFAQEEFGLTEPVTPSEPIDDVPLDDEIELENDIDFGSFSTEEDETVIGDTPVESDAPAAPTIPATDTYEAASEESVELETAEAPQFEDVIADPEPEIELEPSQDAFGLYDSLAEARELAQVASQSEERSRHALYAAVGRAYDVSLAAQEAPAEFDELLEESGLTVQDRAPMTPVVKLVFGAKYDKTRLTEYAAALSHAHRIGIARGKLGTFLAEADGGLKGVVQTERRLRREEAGKPVAPRDAPRESLAKKLRALEGIDLADIPVDGSEFGVVMIRRTEDGDIVVLGEVSDDIPLLERLGRKILN
ncbi:hypothetical protein [Altererythrobacter sp. MF3-039]|uniref:PAS domain-containing protein n=1 Tax=Altererythrobacter sp. MF3-039 TaxID=3252901 RepID=UPI00390C7B9F